MGLNHLDSAHLFPEHILNMSIPISARLVRVLASIKYVLSIADPMMLDPFAVDSV